MPSSFELIAGFGGGAAAAVDGGAAAACSVAAGAGFGSPGFHIVSCVDGATAGRSPHHEFTMEI